MNFVVKPITKHSKVFMFLSFAFAVLLSGFVLLAKSKHLDIYNGSFQDSVEYRRPVINGTVSDPRRKTQRKEYLYRLLTNTTRSLIQMEIKARRLEENMRRIKEKTADLLWKNKDKALWHILFKNISRHISIRHEFHQYSSLKRIMQDSHPHKHKMGKRKDFVLLQ